MAATLQRSSVSFRRQGSSGVVWESITKGGSRRQGGPILGAPAGSQELRLHHIEASGSEKEFWDKRIGDIDRIADHNNLTQSESDQRCGLFNMFRGCMKAQKA